MLIMRILFLLLFMIHIHATKSDSDSLYIDYTDVEESDNCRIAHMIGECREIRKCPSFFYLLVRSKSRPSHRILKLLRDSHCGFKGKEPIVCCPKIYPTRSSNIHEYPAETFELTSINQADLLPSSCGTIALQNKIFGGVEAGLNNFPWMALIGYLTPQGLEYRCGGTLINRRYILTAAHCITNLKSIIPKTVRLGEYDQFSEIDCSNDGECAPPARDFSIKRFISHPGFEEKELRNDIALIELEHDVNFTKSIQPVCLPIEKSQRRRSLDGEMAVISGWGATENGSYSSVLRTTKIRIVPLSECSHAYDAIISIFPSQICAGGQWKDSCRGDSGGPLIIIDKNSRNEHVFTQYGIVSFGPRICGTKGKPGVYTSVPYYMDWITDVMK